MTAHDNPVHRHLASLGARGERALRVAQSRGADLSWGLLAFPPEVACARVELALLGHAEAPGGTWSPISVQPQRPDP
jgi:hypothetical protein